MTHYDISYKDLPEAQAHTKAIQDIKEYLGDDRFDKITKEFQKKILSFDNFAMYASITGVQGFPVQAWYKHCWPKE